MGDAGGGGGGDRILLLGMRVLLVGAWDGGIRGAGGLVRKGKNLKSIAYQENL